MRPSRDDVRLDVAVGKLLEAGKQRLAPNKVEARLLHKVGLQGVVVVRHRAGHVARRWHRRRVHIHVLRQAKLVRQCCTATPTTRPPSVTFAV